VVAVADAGHFPHEEQPAPFTQLLLEWLDLHAH
jgi:pimeloyl-ACP methyl ester carboxylesterase